MYKYTLNESATTLELCPCNMYFEGVTFEANFPLYNPEMVQSEDI